MRLRAYAPASIGNFAAGFGHHHMQREQRSFVIRARTTAEQKAMELGEMFAFHEQLAERLMPPVIVLRGEDDFGVAYDQQAARPVTVVNEADSPDFKIVFRRHDDFHFQ
jgi:hypothetical protein